MAGRGNTTQRGYDWEHQKTRKRLLPSAIGKPCPMCGITMSNPQMLDLDHSVPLALGGQRGDRIVHRSCNRRAGARLGNKLRGRRIRRVAKRNQSRKW